MSLPPERRQIGTTKLWHSVLGPNDRQSIGAGSVAEFYWADAVVKHVDSDCPAVDEDPKRKEKEIVFEYDGFRQSPRGLWYAQ